ncbi:DUF1302 domain-containing protein [Pseudomonas graminis]|uniref:DUF1302 domain-containing protein n=1 Tax=Pseudomonas graminis TaxID=158627 RepID=UPI00300DD698
MKSRGVQAARCSRPLLSSSFTVRTFYPRLSLSVLAISGAMQAHSETFKIGDVEGRFDSTLSIGSSWGTRDPNKQFIGVANGGTASSRTADDGRLNFKKGETFSKIFKGVHELGLEYGSTGVFLRGKYWYDFELKDEHRRLYDIEDRGRDQAARSSGAQLLDAFVYHNYSISDLPASVRLGKQVVSWGESTFIGNSINSINPVDVSGLRRPGSELKESLIPVSMLYLTQGLSDNVSMETFYQLQWEKTVLDNCGTYFGNDTAAKGCDVGLTINGSDLNRGAPSYGYIPRQGDRDARDSGQYGISMRWTLPELDATELAVYAMNYHSRAPEFNWSVGRGALRDPVGGLTGRGGVSTASYYLTYPEDIRLYGVSFNTTLPQGTALSGEISYRPNMPMTLNGTDTSTAAALGAAATDPRLNAGLPEFLTGWAKSSYGSEIVGYKRLPYTQAQATALHAFYNVLGGDRLTIVGEAGIGHIEGLGDTDGSDLRFGRGTTFGIGQLAGAGAAPLLRGARGNQICTRLLNVANPKQCNDKGFYTEYSWGYRARATLDFNDVFAGVNLHPNASFSHNVKGYGPTFTEGNKAISVGLEADFMSRYSTSISYTDYFGGDYNENSDRDFIAASIGVSF